MMEKFAVNCPICDSTKIHSFNKDAYLSQVTIRNDVNHDYQMYHCDNCQTHFLFPLPEEKQIEEYYDGMFREEVHTLDYYDKESLDQVFMRFSTEAELRVDRIKEDLKKTDEILEIGCSVGYFLKAVSHRVSVAYGTEWDSKIRMYIEDFQDSHIKVMKNPEDFNRKFDKIFMFHVLEHIADPVKFLKSLQILLKEEGKIYIEVPNVDDIMIKTFCNVPFMNFYYKKAHLYNFNETGLRYIANQAGYQGKVQFIERYDLSNHLYWLSKGLPGGKGYFGNLLSEQTNEEYVKSLIKAKQTDTLFAVLSL